MINADHIEVSERIQKFYEKFPEGSLQGSWGWLDDTHTVIVYQALAFRDREDSRPGMGCASEPFPGLTNFTRNSEVMNAETSAWGRAIASLGIAVHRGVASAQEVRAAQRGTDVSRTTTTIMMDEDPWATNHHATEVGHTIVPPSCLEPATEKQLKMITAKLGLIGIQSPVTRLEYVNAALLGGGYDQVESALELTKYTAGKVIDALMQVQP